MLYDIIIIGGGPCGATAGYLAAQSHLKVLLLDHAEEGRDKPCGGGVTPKVLSTFPYISDLLASKITFQQVSYLDLKQSFQLQREDPYCYLVHRKDFDHQLITLARDAGCDVRFRSKVRTILHGKESVAVTLSDDTTIFGKYLFGADGISSAVRSQTHLQKYWKKDRCARTYMCEFHLDPDIITQFYTNRPRMTVIFNFADSQGYGWVFASNDAINVGFGDLTAHRSAHDIEQTFRSFVQYAQETELMPSVKASYKPLPWLIPLGGPLRKYGDGRVFLGGDAVGFVHPLSGEGIAFAMYAGKNFVESVVSAKTHRSALRLYTKQCNYTFGKTLKYFALTQPLLIASVGKLFPLILKEPRLQQLTTDMMAGEEKLWRLILRGIGGLIHALLK